MPPTLEEKGGFRLNNLNTMSSHPAQESTTAQDGMDHMVEDNTLSEEDKFRLISWEKWLEEMNLDSRWSK